MKGLSVRGIHDRAIDDLIDQLLVKDEQDLDARLLDQHERNRHEQKAPGKEDDCEVLGVGSAVHVDTIDEVA